MTGAIVGAALFSMVNGFVSKRIARMAAVQAAYQIDLSARESLDALSSFTEFYVTKEKEYEGINLKFYKKLIGKLMEEGDYDGLVTNSLNDGKSLLNEEPLIRSIIKVAIIEMIFLKTDIPVIINEYLEIAKEFVDRRSLKFINAILDKISKTVVRKCLIKQ
jgi:N utilization substance protein B